MSASYDIAPGLYPRSRRKLKPLGLQGPSGVPCIGILLSEWPIRLGGRVSWRDYRPGRALRLSYAPPSHSLRRRPRLPSASRRPSDSAYPRRDTALQQIAILFRIARIYVAVISLARLQINSPWQGLGERWSPPQPRLFWVVDTKWARESK